MPKKRIIGINEIPNTIKATLTMSFNIDASASSATMFFNQGGYSFILEDAEGSRVRFWYVTSNGTQSYFKDDNDLQPRYLNEDPNQAYFAYDSSKPFFGENTSNNDDIANLFMTGTPVRINVTDVVDFLTLDTRDNNSEVYKAAMNAIVSRTSRAINYAEEVKISATSSVPASLKGAVFLEQNIGGPDGNTQFDRNESADAVSLSFYGVLTEDIETSNSNFSGGAVNPSTFENIFSERSGSLSNAIKKEINRKSFLSGFLPSNKTITGKKLIREDIFFDDSLTCIFEEKSNNNSLFGLPVDEATINGKEELFFKYSNINADTIYDTTENIFKNEQLLLRNTGIYSEPNDLNIQLFEKQIHSQKGSIDNFVEQKRVIEKYTPYEEDFGYFTATDSDFETTNIDNNENYNIKNQKQIKISLDFPEVDAYLVNTAIAYNDIDNTNSGVDNVHYTEQINFLNGNKKAVSSNSFPTAYWNFVDNRWEYLDIKSKNISPLGYFSPPTIDTNYVYKNSVFPATVNHDSFSINNGEYDFRESVKNNLLNRPICLSPSFRDNDNTSFLMQPTTSYGFPQKANWQPHDNHVLKMSDYIDENFIVEKIIISGKLSANFEKPLKQGNYGPGTLNSLSDFQQDYSLKQLSSDYISSLETLGFSFFILNQRKNADVVNKNLLISSSSFYTEALKSSFDPSSELITDASSNVYSESVFLNNSNITPTMGEHGIYQFNNKHSDFYEISENNNRLNFNTQFKNKFYHLSVANSLSSNKYEQFLYKDVDDWSDSNYNENLTAGDITKFNIIDSYPSGISQQEVSRDLVSFSNLLIVNDSYESVLSSNNISLNNIDEVIYIDDSSNSVKDLNFTIKSYLKNYEASNFVDESKYSLLSNKTNTYFIRQGTKSTITLEFVFNYDFFSGILSNFIGNLDGFEFSLKCPERFHLKFIDNDSVNDTIYIEQELSQYKNFFNLHNLDSNIWKTGGTESDAAFNFSYFIIQVITNLNQAQNFSNLVFFNENSFNEKIGRIYLSSIVNSFSSQERKSVNFTLEGATNGLQIFNLGLSQNIDLQSQNVLPVLYDNVALNGTSIGITDISVTNTLNNNIKILEGFSKGKENFLGINSERLLKKVDLDGNNITSYSNEINYSFFDENTKNSVVKAKYLLKPEDELIFGINSYGNGDLIASFLELHKNLDITIIGYNQSKDIQTKNNESISIKRLVKESNKRRANIEGVNFTKNNYFSKIFNTKNFKSNKKVIGNSSSNEFSNWGGFISLEETDTSNIAYKKYYYDSILPNFIDIFKSLSNKIPLEDNNILTFIIDDSISFEDKGFDGVSNNNKSKILFKDEWLNNFIFENITSSSIANEINNIRNINNTIDGSIENNYDSSKTININVNENSYKLNEERSEEVSIGNYTLPYTDTIGSNHRIPSKIYNNTVYDFIDSDKNISNRTNTLLLDNYAVKFSIQKPLGFNKWLLVVHDDDQILENNEYPIYETFKSYIEQGSNDFETVTKFTGLGTRLTTHLISTRSIPLTLHIPSFFIGFNSTPFKAFNKKFRVYYDSKTDGAGYDLNNQNVEDYVSTRKYFVELEYWETAEIVKSFSTSDDRIDNFGGDNTGFPYSSSIYSSNTDFIGTNLKNVAEESKQLHDTIGDNNFKKIYDLNQEIENTGQNFVIQTEDKNCNISVSRFTLSNAKSFNRPVLEKELQESFKFKETPSIANTIQTYIDKRYLEDNVEKIINVDEEFDLANTKNQNLLLNEKIYESDVYYIGQGNTRKTKNKVIFKYIKNENNLSFPYIKLLSMKTRSNFFKTKFNKKDSSIFLPENGKIRIYEQNLLDIHNLTKQVNIEDVPYFEVILYENETSNIPFDSNKITLDNLSDNTFSFPEETRGSNIFSIEKNKNELWESIEERDRNINNFIYTFGKRHNSFPIEKCGGFKFGVLNGHKTSPSYKFNAYNYGHFADFIAYSTNAAYIRKNPKTNTELIEYPVQKVFVDNYYNVVSSSSNTFNNNVHSSCSYPYIENVDNELSQLNSNNSLYNAENVY